ncbi:Arc family DNA-binding protein [Escherichia coli]|uniref:Arc family DNA-binding protein n=1 Tax=Escherichia coli TaxID=562 RepID=UPI003CC99AFF
MQDTLFTERKNIKLNLRLPSRLNEDLRRLAEMDCISLNSAIVRLLAKVLGKRWRMVAKNSEASMAATIEASKLPVNHEKLI